MTADPRTVHYADFYDPEALHRARADGRKLLLVVGNCQAEAMRILLDGPVTTLRIPPVHELTAAEVPVLHRIVGATDLLVCQPVRDGYRGLELGARQLGALLGPGSRQVLIPILRETGVFPDHAIVRDPRGEVGDPPLVPYHRLDVLAEAAGLRLRPPDRDSVTAGAALSDHELRSRERAHRTVVVGDVVQARRPGDFLTLNHPGNRILVHLATRVRAALGIDDPVEPPAFELLGEVAAPIDPVVAEVFGWEPPTGSGWRLGDRMVSAEELRSAHLRWYERHPRMVEAGLRRHRDRLRLRGVCS